MLSEPGWLMVLLSGSVMLHRTLETNIDKTNDGPWRNLPPKYECVLCLADFFCDLQEMFDLFLIVFGFLVRGSARFDP